MKTAQWARMKGVSPEPVLAAIKSHKTPYARDAAEIATRALVLQGVVATGCGVDAEPITKWFKSQGLWKAVTANEKKFLANSRPSEKECGKFHWHQEAEWTLLWMIRKVDVLGLPTHGCDTKRLVDEIIPALGSNVSEFIHGAKLRSPGEILNEDDRTYNLWCYANIARRKGEELPEDLNLGLLYERRYAFEWMDGNQEWDAVTCDA
ncbi:MAG TPA: DUF4272 domain-containing protein [Planctomycetota bacterium]|jgi:hypothetical protein